MNDSSKFDQLTRAWLDLMPDEAPDRVVAAVLQAIETEPQASRSVVPSGWRLLSTNIYRAAAAAAVVIVGIVTVSVLATLPEVGRPSVSPSPIYSAGPIPEALRGPWLADLPSDLSLAGTSGPGRMSLVLESNGLTSFVTAPGGGRFRLESDTQSVSVDEIRFVSHASSDPVTDGQRELAGCTAGNAGTYRVSRSTDGLVMTIAAVADECLSRLAVVARSWVRSLGGINSGGLGVVDAFDPLFTVSLPTGSYDVERVPDAITIVQVMPEFQFLAFKDPQGFNDPCDPIGGGRREIAAGADAFVDYFRQLGGFTVDSTQELTVDGHRAVRLLVHANIDAVCPAGYLVEYQTKAMTGDRAWQVSPGVTDSLYIVELPESTLMFEVLPAPHALEAEVVGSIKFLDALPTEP